MATSSTSPSSDLLIRETILGVIKSRDLNREGIIHTSDFRAAVADLGFPFGHPIIENILVHCVINSDGFVDFKGLERELARERRLVNAKANAIPSTRVKTSTETPSAPWRADIVHQQKMQSERQARLLQEKHNDVFDSFCKYENQQSTEDELIENIRDLGIVPTTSFLELLRTHRSCEIGFGEFMRSLINYDPHSQPLDHSRPAGGSASLMGRNDTKDREEHQAGLFYARKRMDLQKKNAMQSSSLDSHRTGKRMSEREDLTYRSRGGGKGGGGESSQRSNISKFVRSSQSAKESLTHLDAPGVGLLSTAQYEMHKGMTGSCEQNLSYTSEQKLLREQVLAALRKLDAGVLSAVEFQDIIFTMGIELPEGVLKQLQLQAQSGLLDWRACVQALDGYVFKYRSLSDEVPRESVHIAKEKLIDILSSSGSLDSLTTLLQLFSQVDENGDKMLTYNEFRKACRDFVQLVNKSPQSVHFRDHNLSSSSSSQLSDSDIRYLFNFFDKNGDGSLSYLEVVSSLQGEVSPRRKDIIRQAFVMMDRAGVGRITMETFLDHFNVQAYPDVKNGTKTEWKALKEIEDFFLYCSHGNGEAMAAEIEDVTFEMFFKNLSPFYESDEDFFRIIREMTGLSNKKPSIQVQLSRGGNGNVHVPIAKQSFGDMIAWNQEASVLEKFSQERSRQKKAVNPGFPTRTDPIRGSGRPDESHLVDGLSLRRTNKAAGSKQLLQWNIPRKQTPTYDTPPKYKSKITIVDEPNQDEMFLHKGYHWSEGKKSQYAGGCPFGVDSPATTPERGNSGTKNVNQSTPRSLAELLSSRN